KQRSGVAVAKVGGFFFWARPNLPKGGAKMTLTRPPGRIETLNGQQLYFEVHGTGQPLLLLHGFSGSSQDWIPSLEQWGAKFQLILPDLRGHGHSGDRKSTRLNSSHQI